MERGTDASVEGDLNLRRKCCPHFDQGASAEQFGGNGPAIFTAADQEPQRKNYRGKQMGNNKHLQNKHLGKHCDPTHPRDPPSAY